MDSLLEALANWKPFTALVVGDFMLDQQLYGDADRLSADAPVPVLRVTRQEAMPGAQATSRRTSSRLAAACVCSA